MTPVHDSTPMDRLAMEYLLLEPGDFIGAFELYQRMCRRCGEEHTQTYLDRARETLKIVGIEK